MTYLFHKDVLKSREVDTPSMRNTFMVFLVLAIAFIAIGLRGPRTFLYVGIVFLVIALLRSRRGGQ